MAADTDIDDLAGLHSPQDPQSSLFDSVASGSDGGIGSYADAAGDGGAGRADAAACAGAEADAGGEGAAVVAEAAEAADPARQAHQGQSLIVARAVKKALRKKERSAVEDPPADTDVINFGRYCDSTVSAKQAEELVWGRKTAMSMHLEEQVSGCRHENLCDSERAFVEVRPPQKCDVAATLA